MKTVKCLRCGTENRAALFYCEKCGTNLHLASLPVESDESSVQNKKEHVEVSAGTQRRGSLFGKTLFIVSAIGAFAWVCLLLYCLTLSLPPEAALGLLVPGLILLCGSPFPLLFLVLLFLRARKRR